ncbi:MULTISPECIES: MFS transporter [unclassified Rhodococcus (in: high G+C Gram-positive bacteria)]|uniref:MFS transporter n=1 Tax=unclassified Rhodococcus (in: high G+C Gram-positive bacteria) TaxID=192944 RepID=UPI0020786611|nr:MULTISPECIES: MFS transporter [unclassified Rhodococcus (in: high G+C Gram-positive bacteria)]
MNLTLSFTGNVEKSRTGNISINIHGARIGLESHAPTPERSQMVSESTLTTRAGSTVTRSARRAIVAASFGTYVEYYDFVVYGYVAVYIAHAYFPSDNPLVGLLLTFGAFAASYVARPLGAVIFSPLGDKYGRKTVLAVVILMMTLATAAIGLLPTYAQIGLFAPILLTVLRVLQGISAGGEYGGATSLIAEFSPPDKRGFYVGFIALTTGLALLTGSIVALSLTRMLPEESMLSWGWRIPLLLSLPLGLVGLYIRFKLEETPHFAALSSQEKAVNKPLATTVKRDYKTVILAIGLAATNASLLAVYFIYMPSALKQFGNFEAADAQLITFSGLAAYCLAIVPFAKLTDKVGRRPQLIASTIALVLVIYPSFLLVSHGSIALAVLGMVIVTPLMAANVTAVLPLLTELFTTANRYTGLSLGWQIATTLFSGPTPVVLAALAGAAGATMPAFYAMAIVALSACAAFAVRETFDTPLQ